MVANIEGQNAAFGRSNPAWHGLGTVVDGLMTTDEALDLANLSDWNVRKEPLTHTMDDGTTFEIPDKFVTTRTNPVTQEREVLAIVGNKYSVMQNEDAFAFTDNVADQGGAQWDTAGSLDEGRRVFGSMVLGDGIVLDPNGRADAIENYLLIATSHDGSLAVTAAITPVRVVCQNTLTMALGNNPRAYAVKHTDRMDLRLQTARKVLGVSHKYLDTFEKEAQTLIQTEITNAKFVDIIGALDPEPTERLNGEGDVLNKSAITRWENRRDLLVDIYTGRGDLPFYNERAHGTAWGAVQAVVEYADYYRHTRGGTDLATAALDVRGTDPVTRLKADALAATKQVLELV